MADDDLVLDTDTPPDDSPIPEPTAATPAVAPETPPAAAAAEHGEVEISGGKYVPVAAVLGERAKRQALERQLEQLSPVLPYAQLLQQHPEWLAPRSPEPVAAQPAASPEADPDLLEVARLLDLYEPTTGAPDLKKAAQLAKVFDGRSERAARGAIEPMRQQTTQQRITENYQRALAFRGADGSTVNKVVLDDLWTRVAREPNGAEALANPEAVAALLLMVQGASAMAKPQAAGTPPAATPPIVTEPSGGAARGQPFLSHLERRLAGDRGVNEEDWAKRTTGFVKGRGNALEE